MEPPVIKGYKPYGNEVLKGDIGKVTMHLEEYEALRLCDYDMFTHEQASVIMRVSRPTFSRIYAVARQKVARAFVEGLEISVDGGKVYFESGWYGCKSCKCLFNNPEKDKDIGACPLCGSTDITNLNESEDIGESESQDEQDHECYCVCRNCGYMQRHERGFPCSSIICPECNQNLVKFQAKGNYPGRNRRGKNIRRP